MKTYDVIVIGAGGWGSATLYHLARRGLQVCGIEQFGLGHDRGSSHGESRVIRMAYFQHPDYVPVLRRAYELWRELETEAGQRLMTLPGLLCIGEPGSGLIRGLEACYATHDLPHERWTAAEARRRYRQFQIGDEFTCYWDSLGGYLNADASVRAHQQLAQRRGAVLFPGEQVTGLDASEKGVTVHTTARTLHAARVVVTTGAFSGSLYPGLVAPVRKVLFWYRIPQPEGFDPGRFPVWIAQASGLNYYGFPTLDGATVKCAEDTGGQALANPREIPPKLQPEDEGKLRPFLDSLFGAQIGERAAFKTCIYETAKNLDFIVDHDPTRPSVVLAFGGSGHGFKFCSVIGEMAADLVEKGQSKLRPDLFTLRDHRSHQSR